jgi:hypothetical protein
MFPYVIEEVRGIIEAKDCYLLSRSYIDCQTKLNVGCFGCGLRWQTTLECLMRKEYPCKVCGLNSTQLKLYGIIHDLYSDAILNYRGFEWLKTKRGTQELDIYVPSVKLAIEYDGEQHFKPVCFGGISLKRAEANLIQTKKLDRRKNRCIRKHKDDICWFVRFNYREHIIYEYVLDKLNKNGVEYE